MIVTPISDVGADDVGTVGGKGASLGELTAAGFPVPPGFVVTAEAYRDALSTAGITTELEAALDVDPDDPEAVSDAAGRARQVVRDVALSAEVRDAVRTAYERLAGEDAESPPVAVRSSATAEDLPDASFAGQQETYLNVTGEELFDRVRDCWASAFTDRAVEYRNRKGFDHAAVDVAVVVQRMVDADRSGVMFTADPSTGAPHTTVEAAWGLGEAVVSGTVSPDNYVLDADGTVESVSVASKEVMCVRDPDTGETVEREVPPDRREERVLSDERLRELADLADAIEAHYGTPQDVEWAIADGDLFVLQSRPITTIPDAVGDAEGVDPAVAASDETAAGVDTRTGRGPGDAPQPTDGPGGESGSVAASSAGIPDRAAPNVDPSEGTWTGDGDPASDRAGGTTARFDSGSEPESETRTGPDPETAADAGPEREGEAPGEVLASGHAASPGAGAGTVRLVGDLDALSKVEAGDVVVTEMTTPDMVSAMSRASAIVTDEGGITSHAAIVARELGVPAVVGAGDATQVLSEGEAVTVDGDRGTVRAGGVPSGTTDTDDGADAGADGRAHAGTGDTDRGSVAGPTPAPGGSAVTATGGAGPTTATGVKVNISMPEAAERAAATGADGVGLVRIEHMVTSLGSTPERFVADNSEAAYVEELVEGIRTIADGFYPRPVRVRTLDAPTDEFRRLAGGEAEPEEDNPMLGYRGIRRSLDRPDLFRAELTAFRRLYEQGVNNVEIMFPLVNGREDARRARDHLEAVGIDPTRRTWGVMIETPAAAMSAAGLCEAGADFVSFGTNDLTQYTLAVDRNNEHVAERYDPLHPAVTQLLADAIDVCRERDVMTSICGQAGSDPRMVRFLVKRGISSVSANPDAVGAVRQEVARVERRLLIDSVR
jgi:pyruvate,water dikinase